MGKHQRLIPQNVCLLALLSSLPVGALGQPANSIQITSIRNESPGPHPFTISRVFASGDIPHFAQAAFGELHLPTQCDVKTRWPDGSVQHAIVSFLITGSLKPSATVSFVDQLSGNNDGAMDRNALLAADWGAQIEIRRQSALTADARKILTDWSGASSDHRVTYWLRGRICTQVILEDRSQALRYDLGWDEYRPLHPIFLVTLYPGSTQDVKVEAILENMWTTKIEDQVYSLSIKVGFSNPRVAYAYPNLNHYAHTRWRKVFWSGTNAGTYNIDANLKYLTYSRVVPNFDNGKTVPRNFLEADFNTFSRGDQGDLNGHGQWLKYMPNTGGRPDIGLFPSWYVRYLYTFSPQESAVFLGNAAVSGYVPIHWRESSPANYLLSTGEQAFGRNFSVDAHPQDYPRPVGPVGNGHGWAVDLSHHGNFAFLPYVLTGDWYWLEELYQWAAFSVSMSDPTDQYYGRHGDWGIISMASGTRGVAWGLRDLGEAAFAAPDGTPEKAYFTEKLNNNIAMREGEQDVRNGAFYDRSANSKWTWGHQVVSEGMNKSIHFPDHGDEYASLEEVVSDPRSAYRVKWPGPAWQFNYFYIVIGHIEELGFPIDKLKHTYLTFLLHELLDPNYNPYLAGTYRTPQRRASTDADFTSWADIRNGFSLDVSIAAWPEKDEADIGHGYPHIAKAAASFLPGTVDGSLRGEDAWKWISTHVQYGDQEGADPRWSLLPRADKAMARCDVNEDGTLNLADIQLSSDDAGNGHRDKHACDITQILRAMKRVP